MMMKRIEGYPNYFVTSEGNVYSIKRKKEITKFKLNSGYQIVSLRSGGKQKSFTVHRLVAVAFIPNPLSKSDVNHIDEDKFNNDKSNLNWMTHKENMRYSARIRKGDD